MHAFNDLAQVQARGLSTMRWVKAPALSRRRVRLLAVALFLLVVFIWQRWSPRKLNFFSDSSTERYLWSTPRSGGFNNQLITIYETIRCAQILNRTVVLPLIYENVRNDTDSLGEGPFPFEDYFDLGALSAVGRFVTPSHFDLVGVPCRRIVFSNSHHFFAHAKRIPRLLFQQYYKKRWGVPPKYWSRIDPGTRELCVDDSVCDGLDLIAREELGSYKNNPDGQGYSIRKSGHLRRIRAAMQPSASVRAVADAVLAAHPGPFNAMHLRRGDFDNKCEQMKKNCRIFGADALYQSPEYIRAKARNFSNPDLPLFVSTTHPDECRRILADSGVPLFFMDDVPLPSALAWTAKRTDIGSYASQIVASTAREFIGNRFSSYTSTINYMRLLEDMYDTPRFF